MQKYILCNFIALSFLLTGCIDNTDTNTNNVQDSSTPELAFFYQYVGAFKDGAGENAVRIGTSSDGVTVQSAGVDALDFVVSKDETDVYGDPVFSRLSNGNWAMTAWTGQADTRGAGRLLYHESACPVVDDAAVIAIGSSSANGCSDTGGITGGKTSQIFEADDANYVFQMINGDIYMTYLSDASHSAANLDSICVLDSAVDSLSELAYGESTLTLNEDNLLLSDTAMGRRTDGTWVLFVKGIEKEVGCSGGGLCELCARGIYRTTSSDLIHWSDLEKVVEQASVPEATTTVDGTVWLYWQDFTNTCTAQDLMLGSIAPISAAYELPDSYELSDPVTVSFPDEPFETDDKIHYATNANPVMLPDQAAQDALAACLEWCRLFERVRRIELLASDWKSEVLPLYDARQGIPLLRGYALV